jgi:GT2 family glycosyltransferase
MKPELSVIVASYKRPGELGSCLEDLAAQTVKSFEVVLVLQAYPPGAADAVRARFSGRLDLRVAEYEQGLGTGGARNKGLELAESDIVAFLDDDVRLGPQWVAAILECYKDPAVGGAGGFVNHPGHYNGFRNFMYRVLGITSNRFKIDWGGFNLGPASNPPGLHPAEWLLGGNMSFRRNAIMSVGGFDESLGAFWHEDADVAHRVLKSGWKVVASDRITLDHFPSETNRPPLRDQAFERERTRVRFVWKVIGDKPLWQLRYALRLGLHAAAMSVIAVAKRDPMIPLNIIRGGWHGYRSLDA